MLERILRPLAVAIGAILAVRLSAYLITKNIEEWLALILAVAGSVLVVRLLEFLLLDVPMQFRALRRLLNPIFTVEGYWYEKVSSTDHPHSYACIEYDPKEKAFRYTGQNFTTAFELNASFSSETIDVRPDAKQISFTFRADVHRPARFIVSGYGRITLFSDGKRSFTRGDGSFVESSYVQLNAAAAPTRSELPMQEVSFQLDRIADAVVRRAIRRRRVTSNADIVALLKTYTANQATPASAIASASA